MSSNREQVDSVLDALHFSLENMHDIKRRMQANMDKGLNKSTNPTAAVKMFPTFVRSLPDGSEKGDFLALDLGGSNFRVLLVKLLDGEAKLTSEVYKIAKELMVGTGEQLFDYIASCLKTFKQKQGLEGKALPLGFTFSFPCRQNGLASATLVTWTKGFSASGVVGEDVADLLADACKRKDVKLDIVAVVNDTTGTLMSCAYTDPNCYIGIILGTGTNTCYMEQLDNVGTWTGDNKEPRQTLINMEWGAFGDDGSLEDIRTDFDREVDKITPNKGKQAYEKMISGMYLGEITRQILVKLGEKKLIFQGKISDQLKKEWAFESKFLTDIEKDVSTEGTECKKIFESLGMTAGFQDVNIVRTVCTAVSTRAAKLATAGLAAVLEKLPYKTVTIGVDGSLFKLHPKIRPIMESFTREMVPDKSVRYMLSEDGSGKGAALIAAVAARLKKN